MYSFPICNVVLNSTVIQLQLLALQQLHYLLLHLVKLLQHLALQPQHLALQQLQPVKPQLHLVLQLPLQLQLQRLVKLQRKLQLVLQPHVTGFAVVFLNKFIISLMIYLL
uniref:Uncharacterized protein n=1 Tax=Cacopsylla melanoneura TaxID=428564 RepID=A0A8D9EZT2_9HEMI